MCSCGLEPETTHHYLLSYNLYFDLRGELLNDICALNPILKDLYHENLLNILLNGSENFSFNTNKKIRKCTIKYLKASERFIGPLIWPFIKQRILSEWIPLKIIYESLLKIICIYVCSTWKQAYYDLFQCWVRYRVGFILLSCIYVDVFLWTLNQYYRKKCVFL